MLSNPIGRAGVFIKKKLGATFIMLLGIGIVAILGN